MIALLALWLVGVLFSAFFSGNETGFYRANRVRLALDSHDGVWQAGGMLWLAKNPALFVATTLIGNNVANYLTSLAIVIGTERIVGEPSLTMELLATILLAPLIFVYGELLPKHLFYQAPNQLLRRSSRLFLTFTVLFAPASALLWGLGRCLQWLLGQAPEKAQSTLARKELQQFLEEGHEVGVLRPAQRQMAIAMFAAAEQNCSRFAVPVGRIPFVARGAPRQDAQRLAHRHHLPFVLVHEEGSRRPTGLVRAADLGAHDTEPIETYQDLAVLPHNLSVLAALMALKGRGETVACLETPDSRIVGVITTRRLTDVLRHAT